VYLELHSVSFPSHNHEFLALLQHCPLLEKVKIVKCGGVYLQHMHYLIAVAKHLVMLYYMASSGDGIIAASFMEEITAAIPAEVVSNPYVKEIRLRHLNDEANRLHSSYHVARQTVYNVVCDMLSKCSALEHITLDELCLPTTSFETSSRLAQVMTTCWTQLHTVDLFYFSFSDVFLQHLGLVCGETLRKLILYFPTNFHHEHSVRLLMQRFPRLESLEIKQNKRHKHPLVLPQPQSAGEVTCRHNLQTLRLSECEWHYPLSSEANGLSLFPQLHSLDLAIYSHDYPLIVTSFPAMANIRTLTLCMKIRYSFVAINSAVMFDLLGYVRLQSLSLSYFTLSMEEFSMLFMLPALHSLSFLSLQSKLTEKIAWFHPDTYPTNPVAPLTTLDLRYNNDDQICLTEEHVRVLLHRLSKLEVLKAPWNGWDMGLLAWERLKEEFRYQGVILQLQDIYDFDIYD